MRGGSRILGGVLGVVWLISAVGCVSLDDHRRMKAANRTLRAEKESLQQELFDERSVNDNLRTKVASLDREFGTQGELLTNLRSENDLLDEMRRTAQGALEDMQGRQGFADISAPKLPAQLDSALKRFADGHPSEVTYDAARGTMKWRGDLLFPLGSDEVKPASLDGLRVFSNVLKSPAAVDFEVIVVGHTDNRPIKRATTRQKHPSNWHLSSHRAIAVGNVLLQNSYSPERVGVMGCSEYRPIAANSTESGASQNRRVEIYLVPTGTIVRTAGIQPVGQGGNPPTHATP